MSLGLIGRKCGMTRFFTDDGTSVPVTVLKIDANRIVQIKSAEKDGYNSVQVTAGERRVSRITKALAGHYAAANTTAGRGLWEFRLEESIESLAVGEEVEINIFSVGQSVDIQGTSIGKGFAGGVKRHNFSMQDATHGNSVSHRVLGSIGMNQTPGRVFKGKKMAGHMGAKKRTVENLKIHAIDLEKRLIMVKGSVPGANGSDVIIKQSAKVKNKGGL